MRSNPRPLSEITRVSPSRPMRDAAGSRMLANVLERLLADAKDRCAGRRPEPIVDPVERNLDDDAVAILDLRGPIGQRARDGHVDAGWTQIGDECAQLVEAVAQHVAQERDLGVRIGLGRGEHAVEILDLEDGVGEDLRRAVVDVLGHALPLVLLGRTMRSSSRLGRLVGHRQRLVDRLVRRVEVAPQQVELASDDVQPLQSRLEAGELATALLVLGAQRIGADRAERAAAAIEPRAELHPVLEVGAVLGSELLGQLVQTPRVTTEALRGLGADLDELLRDRSRRGVVCHVAPAQVPGPYWYRTRRPCCPRRVHWNNSTSCARSTSPVLGRPRKCARRCPRRPESSGRNVGCAALRVDPGRAIPQVQRIRLAVTRRQDHHPPHVVGVDDLADDVEWVERRRQPAQPGQRIEAGRIARHHDVIRIGVVDEEGGRLCVADAGVAPLRVERRRTDDRQRRGAKDPGDRDEPMRRRPPQERPETAGRGGGRADGRHRQREGPGQPGRRRVVEGALRRVEREDRPHHEEHHAEVHEEWRQVGSPPVDPEPGDEEQQEDAAQQHPGAGHQLEPGGQLRADDVHPAPLEVRGRAHLVTDGELLVVRRDPQGVAAGRREDRAEHRQVPGEPGSQHGEVGNGSCESPGHGCPTRAFDPPRRPATPDEPGRGDRDGQQCPVDPRQRGEPGEHPAGDEPWPRPRGVDGPRRAPDRPGSGDAEDREVVDGRVHHQERPGQERQERGAPRLPANAPQLPAHEVRERHERGRQNHERKRPSDVGTVRGAPWTRLPRSTSAASSARCSGAGGAPGQGCASQPRGSSTSPAW